MNKGRHLLTLLFFVLISACTNSEPSQTPTSAQPWNEEDITFSFGPNELFGVVTRPNREGPFPALVLISGSGDSERGVRTGESSRYFKDHARKLALNGFATLRYDPPGVGQSTGEVGFESLEVRADEAMEAVHYMQSRSDIESGKVGLLGASQGAWVNAMAAAGHPQDVAFIVNVSGAGVSVAEQQVHSVEAQSIDAGFSEDDIRKAAMFGRLLVDWQLTDPIFREQNDSDADFLDPGPWSEFMSLVYGPDEANPAAAFLQGVDILKSIEDEPWTEFLYLGLYVSQLESIEPEQAEALKALTGPNLISDPEAYFTRVTSPVLAIFGEKDLLQPTERSAELYEQYLVEAGNEQFEIVVLPGVGHNISVNTQGYWSALTEWLDDLDLE